MKRRLRGATYPIALGPRGGTLRLAVSGDAPRRAVRVVFDYGVREGLRAALAREPHAAWQGAVSELGGDSSLGELARKKRALDVLFVGKDALDPAIARAARLGFRTITATELESGRPLAAAFPAVTIVVAAFAGRPLLEPCLRALLVHTPWPGLEVLVVNDAMAAADSTWLDQFAEAEHGIDVLRNDERQGFARTTNRGLRRARGEFVVVLNDDTVVGPGWLPRLVAHLEAEPTLGLIGACTNEIGNRQRVAIGYTDFAGMVAFATERALSLAGRRTELPSLALFCAAARRSTLEGVGLLDERYEIGMFEDDDLSLALRSAGKRLAVAEDAFVHHVGQASFGRLPDDAYLELWEKNRRRFERKWQVKWSPPAV